MFLNTSFAQTSEESDSESDEDVSLTIFSQLWFTPVRLSLIRCFCPHSCYSQTLWEKPEMTVWAVRRMSERWWDYHVWAHLGYSHAQFRRDLTDMVFIFVFRIWLRWFQTTRSRRRAQKLHWWTIPLMSLTPPTAARAMKPAKPVRAVRVARWDKPRV